MARRATIHDLAQKAGVSVSTIDRIMNGRDKVRAATLQRVLTAAEELQFYALPSLRQRLQGNRPKARLGFLLQQSNRAFYRDIAAALHQAAQAMADSVEVIVEHMNDLSPEAVADRILDLGNRVQALGIVSAEHPRVSSAIDTLAAKGVLTYGLISELTAASGAGYFGLDNWRVGRTAGWAIAAMCQTPGRIGIVVGNHRYRCQELNESGFRSYMREHAPAYSLLEPVQTFEDRSIARDVVEQLLRREPDLVALYIAGGGMPGVLEALRSSGRPGSIVVVGNDLTDHTRMGLVDGVLNLVIAHPIHRLASEAVARIVDDLANRSSPGKHTLGFDLCGPENV